MKVKVGETIYDADMQPIMVILSDEDKINIRNMHPDKDKYCCYPASCDPMKILEWMGISDAQTF